MPISRALALTLLCTVSPSLAWSQKAAAVSATSPIEREVSTYIERYFDMYPTRATESGRHDFDGRIEDFSPARVEAWIQFNRATRDSLQRLTTAQAPLDDRLDAERLLAQIDRELNDLEILRRSATDPLLHVAPVANATVFLLVRDDLPLAKRLAAARGRMLQLSGYADRARRLIESMRPDEVVREHAELAAGQTRSAATFYSDGFAGAFPKKEQASVKREAAATVSALNALAQSLSQLATQARGSFRLGDRYAATFRTGLETDRTPEAVLEEALRDLDAKRSETASFARSVWKAIGGTRDIATSDEAVVRDAFSLLAAYRDTDRATYVETWKRNVRDVEAFVRAKQIMTLPDPLTLKVEISPSYFTGQSVGGVYAAGPWASRSSTILFLPVPREGSTAEEAATFYADFNKGFNRMIVPHELIPGHYTQLKFAALHKHKVRALFPDPVYVEGWGTFCERLLLDRGWGRGGNRTEADDAFARLAHLKKQLENIARAIVDIRVHTQGWTKEDVARFVRDEAFQGEQLGANMWMRTLTTSPQIVTYYLGYREVTGVYDAARAARGTAFTLTSFMDGMMDWGPVSLRHYRARFTTP